VAWGNAQYWVDQAAIAPGIVSLRASGRDDRASASMELVLRAVPNTMWRYGAFGREFMHMDSNARVDSYDSTLGTYAAQAVNGGSGPSAYALSNGDDRLERRRQPRPQLEGVRRRGRGPVAHHDGARQRRGHRHDDADGAQMDMPAINVPTYPSFGNWTIGGNVTLATGDRTYGTLQVNANNTLTINGPANLVVSNLRLRSGARIVINPTNGPVTFYVLDNFIVNSNAQMYATGYSPRDLTINLLSDNVINPEVEVDLDDVEFNSNSKIFGTIYAPTAAIEINSNFELFGSMIARSVDLDSNSRVHFDEALITRDRQRHADLRDHLLARRPGGELRRVPSTRRTDPHSDAGLLTLLVLTVLGVAPRAARASDARGLPQPPRAMAPEMAATSEALRSSRRADSPGASGALAPHRRARPGRVGCALEILVNARVPQVGPTTRRRS
jgi:hypothetical protein